MKRMLMLRTAGMKLECGFPRTVAVRRQPSAFAPALLGQIDADPELFPLTSIAASAATHGGVQ
jgi:hypothetical protein